MKRLTKLSIINLFHPFQTLEKLQFEKKTNIAICFLISLLLTVLKRKINFLKIEQLNRVIRLNSIKIIKLQINWHFYYKMQYIYINIIPKAIEYIILSLLSVKNMYITAVEIRIITTFGKK